MDVLRAMEEDTHIPLASFKVDGGATVNQFLMQFQADILNLNVDRPKVLETTALGAAYLAGLATGFWPNIDAIKKAWQLDQEFIPKMDSLARANYLLGWKKAIQATRSFKLK